MDFFHPSKFAVSKTIKDWCQIIDRPLLEEFVIGRIYFHYKDISRGGGGQLEDKNFQITFCKDHRLNGNRAPLSTVFCKHCENIVVSLILKDINFRG